MNVLRLPGRLLSLWGEPSDEEHLHPGGALVAAGRQRVRCDACPFLAEVLGRVCRTLRLEGSSPGEGVETEVAGWPGFLSIALFW